MNVRIFRLLSIFVHKPDLTYLLIHSLHSRLLEICSYIHQMRTSKKTNHHLLSTEHRYFRVTKCIQWKEHQNQSKESSPYLLHISHVVEVVRLTMQLLKIHAMIIIHINSSQKWFKQKLVK
jgi:hypothetical protein